VHCGESKKESADSDLSHARGTYAFRLLADELSFTIDGSFKMGDILWRDQDGYLYIVDQKETGSYHLHHVASTVAVEHLDQLPEMK
jgi:hypothetical protein